ncbi:MAG: hypothetical protein HYT79_07780 [Elusimicrobia bacterium]|nr:hypothetical protein [Elusimicrobiota bacterium]
MAAKFLLTLFAAVFLGGGLLYLSRPEKILHVHKALRDMLLNDAYVGLHRRRIGSVFVLVGMVILAVAWLEK